MLKILLAIAAISSLGAGTAQAKPAAIEQQKQIGAAQIETRASDQLMARANDPEAKAEAYATRLTAQADYDAEPESISRGTEP